MPGLDPGAPCRQCPASIGGIGANLSMRKAWLYYLPVLFLPNLGFGNATKFGTFELSDLLILPYLLLISFAADVRKRTIIDKLKPLATMFVLWALIGTLLINIRYGYLDNYYLYFSLLKLAKFVLYGFAGFLTARALVNDRARQSFEWSLTVSSIVVGVGLALVGQKSAAGAREVFQGYKASNAISVMAAILLCYLAGIWVRRKGLNNWMRRFVLMAMTVLAFGAATSEGRGGWFAAVAGLSYLCWGGKSRRQTIVLAIGVPLFIWLLYLYFPAFRNRVDVTLSPKIVQTQPGVAGIDDGARTKEFRDGLSQFSSPVFGTGFFHRGGASGLYPTGSHNFFLQMFLETGIPGGILILAILSRLWQQAGSCSAKRAGLDLPVKAALVAAFIGGMSGEYFYGGMPLLALFAVYAPIGSLPRSRARVIHRRDVPVLIRAVQLLRNHS